MSFRLFMMRWMSIAIRYAHGHELRVVVALSIGAVVHQVHESPEG